MENKENMKEKEIIEKISQLNVELSSLTRELAKKNRALKEANAKITMLLNTDFLTGIYNRRYFFERLEEFISLKKRKSCLQIGIILADIDYFKKVNDTYGHDIGDVVLKKFAQMIKDSLRKEDFVSRIGGEEFCVIIQCEEDCESSKVAEKLRVKCEALEFENKDLKITASFGVDHYQDGDTIDTLMKRVDINLYQAKQNGRNRVVFD